MFKFVPSIAEDVVTNINFNTNIISTGIRKDYSLF